MDRRRIRGEGASGEVRVQAPGPLDHSPASAIPAGDAFSAAHGQGALTTQHVGVVEPAADRVTSAMQLTTCSPLAEVPYPRSLGGRNRCSDRSRPRDWNTDTTTRYAMALHPTRPQASQPLSSLLPNLKQSRTDRTIEPDTMRPTSPAQPERSRAPRPKNAPICSQEQFVRSRPPMWHTAVPASNLPTDATLSYESVTG